MPVIVRAFTDAWGRNICVDALAIRLLEDLVGRENVLFRWRTSAMASAIVHR